MLFARAKTSFDDCSRGRTARLCQCQQRRRRRQQRKLHTPTHAKFGLLLFFATILALVPSAAVASSIALESHVKWQSSTFDLTDDIKTKDSCDSLHVTGLSLLSRSILEVLILPLFALTYFPIWSQISFHGRTAISPYWVLCLCLFSTTQLLNRVLSFNSIYAAECIVAGNLRGIKAFLAILTFLEVVAQWFSVIILLYFFSKHCSPQDALYATLPSEAEDKDSSQSAQVNTLNELMNEEMNDKIQISSKRLNFIVVIQIILFLGIAFGFFVVSGGTAGLERGSPAAIIQYISIALAFSLVICLNFLQVHAECYSRENEGISILALAFQFMSLLVLASFQASGPAYPIPDAGWIMNAWNWYLNVGNVSVHYFIMAFGYSIVLGIRAFHLRRAAVTESGRDETLEMD